MTNKKANMLEKVKFSGIFIKRLLNSKTAITIFLISSIFIMQINASSIKKEEIKKSKAKENGDIKPSLVDSLIKGELDKIVSKTGGLKPTDNKIDEKQKLKDNLTASAKSFLRGEIGKEEKLGKNGAAGDQLFQDKTSGYAPSNTSDSACVDDNISASNYGRPAPTSVKAAVTLAQEKDNGKKTPVVKVNWFNTKLRAKDIGTNSQGDLYVVGLDGFLYKYEFLTDTWCKMEGDFEMTKITRVDVAWDGIPYVITETGDTFYLSCEHKWMRLPGCASDIGIGRGGEIYKTGCDQRDNGYGIYRLYCACPSTCCYKGCLNWRKPCHTCWSHKGDEKQCSWFRIDGSGLKLDVAPSGNPYVIDQNGNISQFDGTNWRNINILAKAYDLTISNEGVLFYIGQDGKIYKSVNEQKGDWIILSGEADAITAGPFSQPWVIRHSDKSVLASSKFEYN